MRVFSPDELDNEHRYRELLRVPAMSVGVYRLAAGAFDRQRPHAEDEVYFVVAGRAAIVSGDTRRRVEPGSVIFVPAREQHRFEEIDEDLVVLVVFAPAESG
jgi:mannose-6-phosphate isomerase-like protein (cupin superfamily)